MSRKKRYIIKTSDLVKTCDACPSQWQGHDIDGHPVYIRYRWGHLTIQIAHYTEDPVGDGEYVFESELGDEFCGVLSTEDMKNFVNSTTDLVKFIS